MQLQPTALGYGELLGNMSNQLRKNRFIKFLLVFPIAFLAYALAGGLGPFLQNMLGIFETLIIPFQIILFFHLLGSGNFARGIKKAIKLFDGSAWERNNVMQYILDQIAENLLPLFVNLMIFAGLMIGLKFGFTIAANLKPVQGFLENWNILYPGAGARPLYQFWYYNSIVPMALSFAAGTINWLFLNQLTSNKS